MCGRQTNTFSWEEIHALLSFRPLHANFGDFDPNRKRYNLAPGQMHYVITAAPEGFTAHPARWGLVPHWAKDAAIAFRTINARAETVAEKPAYRDAFADGRCLIPASGYFEWTGPKSQRQPWYVLRRDGAPLFFAGVSARWLDPKSGAPLQSYSVVTRPAESTMCELHSRMPLMLREKEFERWLGADAGALRPLDLEHVVDELTRHPVASRVNRTEEDDAGLLEEAGTGWLF
jgi:putative SOS response-associated peptidase YedK